MTDDPPAEDTKLVSGVDELKAVAHPLRVKLLAALRQHGPANATELAKRFATDTGSTSYHLRKLAEFGFVAEADEPGGHPRARRWRAVHRTTSWRNTDFAASAEGREVTAFMRRRQLETLAEDIERFEAQLPELPPDWAEAFGLSDYMVRLTPAAMTELQQRFQAMLDELADRAADDPEARDVGVFAGWFPR